MNRRDLLELIGAASVVPILAPLAPERRLSMGRAVHARLAGRELRTLSPQQNAVVTRLAEIIIPETDTPGATTAKVNEFVDLLLTEWYSTTDRDQFLAGLADIDARGVQAHGAGFADLGAEHQIAIVRSLDGERGPDGSGESAFRTLKGLTVYGYFTSEIVVKDVLKNQLIPGRFDGCVEEPAHGR